MRQCIIPAAAFVLAAVFATPANAQSNVPNNMGLQPYQQVAPLAPPPQPTPNPLSRNAPSSAGSQPPVDSFGDKVTRCLHYGASQGLTGGDLSSYSRACANN